MYYDYSASFISYHSTSGSKIKDKEGKPKLHTLAAEALNMYRQRWQIKTMFKGLESSGFNNEDPHVRIQKRMANLEILMQFKRRWTKSPNNSLRIEYLGIRLIGLSEKQEKGAWIILFIQPLLIRYNRKQLIFKYNCGDGRTRTAVQTPHRAAFYTLSHPLVVGHRLPDNGLPEAYPRNLGGA